MSESVSERVRSQRVSKWASERPIANPVVVIRAWRGGWSVLFNPDTADAVGVNAVGMAMWALMDGRHSLDDIRRAVEEAFADVPGGVARDVAAFVDDLAARGFVGYALDG